MSRSAHLRSLVGVDAARGEGEGTAIDVDAAAFLRCVGVDVAVLEVARTKLDVDATSLPNTSKRENPMEASVRTPWRRWGICRRQQGSSHGSLSLQLTGACDKGVRVIHQRQQGSSQWGFERWGLAFEQRARTSGPVFPKMLHASKLSVPLEM